jgi:hypothetical protein
MLMLRVAVWPAAGILARFTFKKNITLIISLAY